MRQLLESIFTLRLTAAIAVALVSWIQPLMDANKYKFTLLISVY
jgi:hypothetical protein